MKLHSVMLGLWLTVLAGAVADASSDLIFYNGFDPPQATCPSPAFATRQYNVNVKFGTKAGTYMLQTEPEVFKDTPTGKVIPFPQVGNRAVSFAVTSNQYVALEFTAPATKFASRFGMFDTNYLGTPAFPPNNGISYSVSTCAGEINVVNPACKAQWNGADGTYLTVASADVADPTNQLCKLEAGKTYYLNITTSTLAQPSVSACANTNCAVSMSYFRVL